MKILFLNLLLFMAALSNFSCKNDSKSSNADVEQVKGGESDSNSGPEYTSAYICPMHCKGSGSDKPGQCPVCQMDYVENKDLKGETHPEESADDHDEEGHQH